MFADNRSSNLRDYEYQKGEAFVNNVESLKNISSAFSSTKDLRSSSISKSESITGVHSQAKTDENQSKRDVSPMIYDPSKIPNNNLIADVLNQEIKAGNLIKVKIDVPNSKIKRAKGISPAMIYKSSQSGEVMPYYLVGDPSPSYDPIVSVKAYIVPEVINFYNKSSSNPKPNYQSSHHAFTMRDTISKKTPSPPNSLRSRIEEYSRYTVRSKFLPVPSEKKKLELDIIKERLAESHIRRTKIAKFSLKPNFVNN